MQKINPDGPTLWWEGKFTWLLAINSLLQNPVFCILYFVFWEGKFTWLLAININIDKYKYK